MGDSFPYPGQPSHKHFKVTIEQSLCAAMAENVAPLTQPVNEQAVDTASESQKRGSATAGMFSDLTVDV